MPRLVVFNNVTVDGYFAAVNGDIGWAHRDSQDAEFQAFVADNAEGGGRLLFGRRTYEIMTSYWPTPLAAQNDPVLAERMNALPKVVFSRTLDHASWNNTRVVNGDIAEAVRTMKREPGPDMVILGSGTIVSQLSQAGLIDEYQLVVNPVVLGQGRTMYDGISVPLSLKLARSRTFRRGRVFLCYEPAARSSTS
jgi:dihydrofolate reductase